MSLFNSLKQLWIKIQQKNVVLVSGNIDELIPVSFQEYKDLFNKAENNNNYGFVSLDNFIANKAQELNNIQFISSYSPNSGNIVYYQTDNFKIKKSDDNQDDLFFEQEENFFINRRLYSENKWKINFLKRR